MHKQIQQQMFLAETRHHIWFVPTMVLMMLKTLMTLAGRLGMIRFRFLSHSFDFVEIESFEMEQKQQKDRAERISLGENFHGRVEKMSCLKGNKKTHTKRESQN